MLFRFSLILSRLLAEDTSALVLRYETHCRLDIDPVIKPVEIRDKVAHDSVQNPLYLRI